ncbi:DUF2267 domain-containing protein [Catalinimonas niigatensis]|uniref:DUF2267 domain-containing protein n=1 Tax=Catalinimonas niigatensis TaxID=1397264 RepID=UPI00266572CA|nr:DUF2267 domain-containing protein [Catalinimonas niigatensis]WPP49808.1 DUF2267 domain-containing protein [Catalinimonas niigatensis]
MTTHYFDHYASEANKLLIELAKEIQEPDNVRKAERILKAVLHTLRDRIPMQESFQLIAQLPLFIKGMYVTEWKYGEKPSRIRHMEEFIDTVKIKNRAIGEDDFGDDEKATFIIKKIFKALGKYVSPGEWEDIMDNLPKELHPLIRAAFT